MLRKGLNTENPRIKGYGQKKSAVETNKLAGKGLIAAAVALAIISTVLLGKMTGGSDAERAMAALTSSSEFSIIDDGELNRQKLISLDYRKMSGSLGLKSDIAFYFEDGREIRPIGGAVCFGSSSVKINGFSCAEGG